MDKFNGFAYQEWHVTAKVYVLTTGFLFLVRTILASQESKKQAVRKEQDPSGRCTLAPNFRNGPSTKSCVSAVNMQRYVGSPVRAPKTPFPPRDLPSKPGLSLSRDQEQDAAYSALGSSAAASGFGSSAGGASAWAAARWGSASDEVQRVCGPTSAHASLRQNAQGTYQVVTEQLHDQGAVLVALLAQCVELWGGMVSNEAVCRLGTENHHSPAMASSNACLARWQAWSGALRIS